MFAFWESHSDKSEKPWARQREELGKTMKKQFSSSDEEKTGSTQGSDSRKGGS